MKYLYAFFREMIAGLKKNSGLEELRAHRYMHLPQLNKRSVEIDVKLSNVEILIPAADGRIANLACIVVSLESASVRNDGRQGDRMTATLHQMCINTSRGDTTAKSKDWILMPINVKVEASRSKWEEWRRRRSDIRKDSRNHKKYISDSESVSTVDSDSESSVDSDSVSSVDSDSESSSDNDLESWSGSEIVDGTDSDSEHSWNSNSDKIWIDIPDAVTIDLNEPFATVATRAYHMYAPVGKELFDAEEQVATEPASEDLQIARNEGNTMTSRGYHQYLRTSEFPRGIGLEQPLSLHSDSKIGWRRNLFDMGLQWLHVRTADRDTAAGITGNLMDMNLAGAAKSVATTSTNLFYDYEIVIEVWKPVHLKFTDSEGRVHTKNFVMAKRDTISFDSSIRPELVMVECGDDVDGGWKSVVREKLAEGFARTFSIIVERCPGCNLSSGEFGDKVNELVGLGKGWKRALGTAMRKTAGEKVDKIKKGLQTYAAFLLRVELKYHSIHSNGAHDGNASDDWSDDKEDGFESESDDMPRLKSRSTRSAACRSPRMHRDPEPTAQASPRWMVNSEVKQCMLCANNFGMLVRPHHCRACGWVVCDGCSRARRHLYRWLESSTPHRVMETRSAQRLRVCTRCEPHL
eukprot:COSAG02_NODE_715_length_18086_cov_109.753433_9_plen_635_part_00